MSRPAMTLVIVASFAGAVTRPAHAEAPPSETAPRPLFPIVAPPPPTAQVPSLALPAPPPATTVHRRHTAPLVGGAVIFGLTWGGAVFLSAALINCRCTSRDQALGFAVPILGPVMSGPKADGNIWYLWSAAQLGGALLLGYGIKGEDVPMNGEAPVTRAARLSPPEVQLTPLLARDARGMALTARW